MSDGDWMQRLSETTDRFREAEEALHNPQPKTVKRPYATPSGAIARSVNHKNATQRLRSKGLR